MLGVSAEMGRQAVLESSPEFAHDIAIGLLETQLLITHDQGITKQRDLVMLLISSFLSNVDAPLAKVMRALSSCSSGFVVHRPPSQQN